VKRHLKLLYFLTLGTLCLCLTAGPAGATTVVSGPQIVGKTIQEFSPGGNVNWTTAPAWDSSSRSVLKMDGTVSCGAGGGVCSAEVDFWFSVSGATPLTVTLGGTSTDPGAFGSVSLEDPLNISEGWFVVGDSRGGSISMTPFIIQIPVGYLYSGELFILMQPGTVVDLGDESLDLTVGTPEPGSALLLCGGLALVEFLRRKIRR
jgi:hypothetical protein